MKYEIYQAGRQCKFRFWALPDELNNHVKLAKNDYTKVYEGEIDKPAASKDAPEEMFLMLYGTMVLDELFYIFNHVWPQDYKGSPMNASDIVILEGKAYYCDICGWKEITVEL